jgi:hypothetical protein
MLKRVQFAHRAYDPCFVCASHCLPGQMLLEVVVRDAQGEVLAQLSRLPDDIVIVAVEAENVLDFGEGFSPQVAASEGRAAKLTLAELDRFTKLQLNRGAEHRGVG